MTHHYLSAPASPRVFAHRGLVTPALAEQGIAENTFASFEAAEAAGALYIESDCHLTSDGVAVLFHDSDLRRVAGDPRAIAAVGHAELAALMAERGGLLTLEDALERFPRTRFNLDVKAALAAEQMGRIVAPYAERVLLTSFDDESRLRALAAARAARASTSPATSPGRSALVKLLLAVTLGGRRARARALAGFDALQIPERHGAIRVLSPRLIDAAHEAGVEVHVWTVNEPARMRELVALGVDGIITDRADLALSTLGGAAGSENRGV